MSDKYILKYALEAIDYDDITKGDILNVISYVIEKYKGFKPDSKRKEKLRKQMIIILKVMDDVFQYEDDFTEENISDLCRVALRCELLYSNIKESDEFINEVNEFIGETK